MKSFWKSHFLTLILVASDVVAFSLLWRESWELRRVLYPRWFSVPINSFDNYRPVLPLLLVIWIGVMAFLEHYAHRTKIYSLNQIRNIIKAGLWMMVLTMAVAYLLKRYDIGRAVIIFSATFNTLYAYVSRSALRWIKEFFVARGHGLTRVAVIGAGDTGRALAARIKSHPEIGYELVGFIDRDPAKQGDEIDGVPVIGDGSMLVDLLLRHRVEEVFLAVPGMASNDQFALITDCEQAKVHFKLLTSDLLQVIAERVKLEDIGDFSVITFPDGHLTPLNAVLKRLLDLAVAIPLLLISLPVMAVCALLIRMDGRGPIIFIHDRIGKDGRRFRMLKFRTMKPEADPYEAAPNDASDSRITRFGRFLRKTSLDELPQVINVIKGEMSMVGPRPEMPFVVEQYEPWQRRRLDVPQGISGLWQIAGRKELPLHLNLEFDFYYIRNWSLMLDIVILIRTIPAVLFGAGAF